MVPRPGNCQPGPQECLRQEDERLQGVFRASLGFRLCCIGRSRVIMEVLGVEGLLLRGVEVCLLFWVGMCP